jgi:hypothetical protein
MPHVQRPLQDGALLIVSEEQPEDAGTGLFLRARILHRCQIAAHAWHEIGTDQRIAADVSICAPSWDKSSGGAVLFRPVSWLVHADMT